MLTQRTLLDADPAAIADALSRLGWDQAGPGVWRRGETVREVADEAAWLAAGAPERDPVTDLAVLYALDSGPQTRAQLRRALAAAWDVRGLGAVVRRLVAAGDVIDEGGALALPEVGL